MAKKILVSLLLVVLIAFLFSFQKKKSMRKNKDEKIIIQENEYQENIYNNEDVSSQKISEIENYENNLGNIFLELEKPPFVK